MKKTIFLLLVGLVMGSTVSAQVFVRPDFGKPSKQEKSAASNAFTGYYNITDIGFLIGSPDNSRVAPFSFMMINGLHLTKQFSAGIGIGLEFPTGSYLPITLDLRYYLRDESFSPYFSLSGGYAIPLDDDGYYNYDYWSSSSSFYEDYSTYTAKGGFLLNPSFGFRHMFGENFGVLFNVGYRYQRLHYSGEKDREIFTDYNRLSLKFGITFR